MLMRPMHLPVALLVFLLSAPLPAPGGPTAVAVIPDEPDVVILADAPTLQTVAADVDGDGRREIVRLIRGTNGANAAVQAEIWGESGDRWARRGDPVEIVPWSQPVYPATPVHALVRRVDGRERVTIASQPQFGEIDVGQCCLVLHDLGVVDGEATATRVAERTDSADALLVIDFDGDGTDELLSTRSLPPLGDLEFPILARVHRWSGASFARPTETRLPVGSGHAPVALRDSDGLPGDEAAILSEAPGLPQIYRLRLVDGDEVVVDAGGAPARQAAGVGLASGRGVALVGPSGDLTLAAWPAGGGVVPEPSIAFRGVRLVGVVPVPIGGESIVIHEPISEAVHLLNLANPTAFAATTVTRSPAAAALSDSPFVSFSGLIPGGGIDGEPVVIHQGRLIPSPVASPFASTSVMASLGGAQPIGLVGDRDLLVLDHSPRGLSGAAAADGGALGVPAVRAGSWTSVVPFATVIEREVDDGELQPLLRDARPVDGRGTIEVGPGGFVAELAAPPGSRIFPGDADPSVVRGPIVVRASGRADVPFAPPNVAIDNPRYRATLVVQTPAGRTYRAAWNVRVRNAPPPLEVEVSTPFGSSAVEVTGRAEAATSVEVDGVAVALDDAGGFATTVELPPWPTDVVVEAADGLGNQARRTVSGVGWLDYRGLPWVPITALALVAVGTVLFLRVPRATPPVRRADDDAVYEEIEPD